MKIKLLAPCLLMLTAFGARATDLLEVFHLAQSNDPIFAAAQAAQQAGREKLPQGRALMLPAISFAANSTMNTVSTQFAGPVPPIFQSGTNRYNSNGYGVTLVQPLLRQQNRLAYSEAQLQVVQSDAQFKIAGQDLLLRSAQVYFDVLLARDNVQLSEAQKTANLEQLALAKRSFEIGSATITDTNEAQARHDLTYAQQVAAQNNLEVRLGALQQLINVLPDELKPLGKKLNLNPPLPAGMEKWQALAQLHSPQLVIAQTADELAAKEVARNRSANYPTVDLVANYINSNAAGSMYGVGVDNVNKSIGVQLNIPIYQGGALNSKWREAEHNRERARQELENARRSVTQQIRQAYLGVVNGIAQVSALQQALVSSESVLESSKLGQEVGVRTNLDVLNAQQQLYSTRRDLYQAEYNYLLSQLHLKAAAGTLEEADLAGVNQALD